MIALIQRVTQAKVEVEGQIVGQIGKGLLVLLGVEKEDDRAKADKLAEKVLNYRIFSDENDKMNLNVQQIGGEVLVVSQFTLVLTRKKAYDQVSQKVPHQHWPTNCMAIFRKNALKKSLLPTDNLRLICK